MTTRSPRKTLSQIVIYLVMGLLFVALAGFGIGSFSGGASRLGAVGDVEITAQDYAQAIETELRAQSASGGASTFAQLQALGVDAQIRQGLFARAALDHETGFIGLSVTDADVARQITEIPAFQGADGQFDRAAYDFFLTQRGLSPAEFEEDVRADTARSILQLAILGAGRAPQSVTDLLVAFQQEQRDFSILRLSAADLTAPLPSPSDDDLRAHLAEFSNRFLLPETRMITYAWVTPAMIMDQVPVADSTLRGLYEDRIDDFRTPERRLVERLVFPDEASAQDARARLDAGEIDFEGLVAERGLAIEDTDMGDVTFDDLAPEAAAAVFADRQAEIVGPVASEFGPALFRINAVLDAQEITFEEVQEDLRAELASEAARRAIADLREGYDDLLASGASLQDLADQSQMQLGEIAFDGRNEDDIAAYDAFREAAATVELGDFPQLLDLSDGGIFALELTEIIAPRVPELEEARAPVEEDWRQTQLGMALGARGQEIMAEMAQTGRRLELYGPVTRETAIKRGDFIPDTITGLVTRVFALSQIGERAMVQEGSAVFLLRLDAIRPAAEDDPSTAQLRASLGLGLDQSLAADLFESFGRDLQRDVGLSFNESVANQVHAAFP